MRRKTFDGIVTAAGLVLALVLLVAGGLLSWASGYIGDQVTEQLSMQSITMPEKDALESEAQHAALDEYAGQQMTDGDQAKAFADHYILEHMNASSEGRTYEEVSGEYMGLLQDPNADPEQVEHLGQLRQTLFMGNTLRGLLLNAYAFDTMGEIAGYAAIASFSGAAALLLLVALGFVHMRRSPEDAVIGSAPRTLAGAGV